MDELFRFPTARAHDPAIDPWFTGQRDDLRALAERWFARLRAAGPDVRELVHDGRPTACVEEAAFAYVEVFREHVNLGFFFGSSLADPARLLEGTGKRGRHVKLRPSREVDEVALEALVAEAHEDMRRRLRK